MSYTYSEIKDQYNALKKTLAYVDGRLDDARALMDGAAPRSLTFLGCGSSYSVAKSLALAARMNLGLPAQAIAAGDYLLHAEAYAGMLGNTLAIVLSRSGSTSEVIAAVERMKADCAAHVLGVTAAEGSPLAGLSDLVLDMPWCFDRSVCQTRTVSCLYAAGMRLVAGLSGNTRLAESLGRAAEDGASFMAWFEKDLKFIASNAWTNAVVLADAELAGIGEEAALAFKEICQRPSGFYHVLDARHGPMVLIGRDTLVIAAFTGSQYELDLAADVAAKGASLIVYSDTPLKGLPDRAVNICFGNELVHAARGLPLVLIAQMIAYWRAVADGVDPDHPQGLDPWIRL